MKRYRRTAAAVAVGAALATIGGLGIDLVTEGADAQRSGAGVTLERLKETDRRSQAAINGYKNLNNVIGKYATAPGSVTGANSGPIRQERGLGTGLPTDLIADGAITAAKLADDAKVAGPPGSNATINGVTAGGDLTGTYPNPDIGPGTVGMGELDQDAQQGLAAFARVGSSGGLVASRGFLSATLTGTGIYELVAAQPVTATNCAATVTVDDEFGGVYLAKYSVVANDVIEVRVFEFTAGAGTSHSSFALDNEPFGISLFCV